MPVCPEKNKSPLNEILLNMVYISAFTSIRAAVGYGHIWVRLTKTALMITNSEIDFMIYGACFGWAMQ